MVWLTWPIFACATVDLEFYHSMPITEINDAVDDGPVDDGVCRTLDGRR